MRAILAVSVVVLRHVGAALLLISAASCAHLLVLIELQDGLPPLTSGPALTPAEERAWTGLVAQLTDGAEPGRGEIG